MFSIRRSNKGNSGSTNKLSLKMITSRPQQQQNSSQSSSPSTTPLHQHQQQQQQQQHQQHQHQQQQQMAESEENVEDYPMQSSTNRASTQYSTISGATATALTSSPTMVAVGGNGNCGNTGSGSLHTPFVAITSPESRMEPPDANSVVFKVDQHRSETFEVMYAMYRANKLTDVQLTVDREVISCHKIVLAGASLYFRAMFTGDMRESDMPSIPIYGVSPLVLQRLIQFAYTGEIVVNERNVCDLLPAAVMLQMHHVVNACCSYLEQQLHPSNCIGILAFAHAYGCMELTKKAQSFIDQCFSELWKHDEFTALSSSQLCDIIRRDELSVRSETEVFNAVVRWVNADQSSRTFILPELLSYVRCYDLPPRFISSQLQSCPLILQSSKCTDMLQRILSDLRHHARCPDLKRLGSADPVIYSAGGYLRYSLTCFECYNLRTQSWLHLKDIPSPRSGLAACSTRGCVYLVGGRNNNEHTNIDAPSLDCYDPSTNEWTKKAPMSVPRNRVAVGVIDDMIYAVGGSYNRQMHDTAEKYDPDRDQWLMIAPMNSRRIGLGVAVVNRLLYAVGGFDGNHRLDSVERYDPERDRWETIASMNQRRSGQGVVAVGQYIYAIGGYDSSCQLRTVERYDTERNVWEFVASMCRPRSALSATVLRGKIWVFGGYDGDKFLTSVEVYDPATDAWTEVTDMDCGKSGHAIVVGRAPAIATSRSELT